MTDAVGIPTQQESNASTEKENENSENQKKANTSNENKTQNERWVDVLKLVMATPVPSLSTECRIKRIPDHLRRVNEQAYTPMIISIGPIHHFDKKLQIMEMCKAMYFQRFIDRTKINLENLVSALREMEVRIRSCYAETISFKDEDDFETTPFKHEDDFVKIILVDAVFILELFHRYHNNYWERGDPMFLDQLMFMKFDLVLLENQLPFFVLEKLFNLTPDCSESPSLIDLTVEFFAEFKVQESIPQNVKIAHFTDLIRTFQLPQQECPPESQTSTQTPPQNVRIAHSTDLIRAFQLPQQECPPESQTSTQTPPQNVRIAHFTDLIRTFLLSLLKCLPGSQTGTQTGKLLYSAAQLHEAGVKFKPSKSKCLHDIKFEITTGELEIPLIELNDGTETLIRNVMAYEQFRYPEDKHVTDYFVFLDDLINTTQDMDLLCKKKIVINYLGDNNAATRFFNNLNTYIFLPGDNSNYNHIYKKLNEFCEISCNRWKATFWHDYCSNPWRTASTIAAIILLVLTFIQTVCSIIQIVPIV